MDDIFIPSTLGPVRISFPYGSAGVSHIYIGNWFQGQVAKQLDGWHVYLNEKSELSPEDSEVIIAAVKNHGTNNHH